jgi:hypothetical protein
MVRGEDRETLSVAQIGSRDERESAFLIEAHRNFRNAWAGLIIRLEDQDWKFWRNQSYRAVAEFG